MNKLVIDASVVLDWIETERSIKLFKLLKSGEITVYAPFFLLVEIVNVLYWKKKKEISGIKEFIDKVRNSGINFVDGGVSPDSIYEILDLMDKHNITAYDAQYVYLAKKLECKLATFDEKLMEIKNLLVDME